MLRPVLLTAAASVTVLAGVMPGVTAQATAPAAVPAASSTSLLNRLPVKLERPAGYQRSKFVHWTDADHDGCDTRAEVLITEATRKPRAAGGCRLIGGKWTSVYDGKVFTDASRLDVDHMVPLNEAWQSGAWRWTPATRKAFANDLGYTGSLIGVSATTNRSKGDQQPGEWNPPNPRARCRYYGTWVNVKYRWGLSVDPVEKATLTRYLKTCGTAANIPAARKAPTSTQPTPP